MNYSFGTINITKKSKQLINRALSANNVSCGKLVGKFEQKFALIAKVKQAVAVSSGADADALSLAVLYDYGAKRNDEIIVPSLTFVATANAVLQAGFIPRFVDVQRHTLNIDPNLIEKAITKKTKAIMPVHLMGKPAAMSEINAIAKAHKLMVIADAAQAHGCLYKGKPISQWADITAYSLYVAHIISSVEGGMVATNNGEYADIVRSLRSHGRACKCKVCVLNLKSRFCSKRFNQGQDIRFIFERVGFSSKMNELEAAIGLGAIDEYNKVFSIRRKNLLYLIERFKRFEPRLETVNEEKHELIGPHAFAFWLGKEVKFTREQLAYFLEKSGINTRTLFECVPTQCLGYKFLNYRSNQFPQGDFLGHNGLHIGVHQDITRKHLDYFLERIEYFLNKHS